MATKELDEITAEEEYDRMVEHLKSACATCVYSFPVSIGYSCGITRKVTSDVWNRGPIQIRAEVA